MSALDYLEDTKYEKILTYDRKIKDDMLINLITDTSFAYARVEPNKANVYIGDFHGLLKSINVTEDLLNLTTRINGLLSSTEFNGDFYEIKLLTPEFIEKINLI